MNRLLTIWQSLSGRILLIGISLITVLAIVVCIMLARFLLMDPPKSPINPLPPDEELIEFFYQHRAEIEELVRRYREYVPPQGKSHGEWEKMGNTKELFLQGG